MITNNSQQTIAFGKKLSQSLKGGDILCLYGELGAGKTTLVKGIAQGFGVKQDITSPTFALMNVYDIKTLKHENIKTFVHIDTYRLKDGRELVDIGVEDYLGAADTVCVVEWPEKIESLLRGKKVKKINIGHVGERERKIIVEA